MFENVKVPLPFRTASTFSTTPGFNKTIENLHVITLNRVALSANTDSLANGVYFIVKRYSDGRHEIAKIVIRH